MVKIKGRIRHTYMSDRYDMKYHLCEDGESFSRNVWEDSPYVGPESYDLSHIDLIMDDYSNRARYIIDGSDFILWAKKPPKHQQFRP